MRSFSNKNTDQSNSINKKIVSTLRKKISVIDPAPSLDLEETTLISTAKRFKEPEDKNKISNNNIFQIEEPNIKKDLYMTTCNKIYNKTNKMRMIDQLNDSNYLNNKHHQPNSIQSQHHELQMRPKSSHNNDKYQKSIDIYQKPSDIIKHEVRPGSSKSSRLFKKKTSLANDIIKSQNQELDDTFIKVTNNRQKQMMVRGNLDKQRIGTSISKKTRSDKFQTKLDPEFFNLFAQ